MNNNKNKQIYNDCVTEKGKPFQSKHQTARNIHARNLIPLM